MKRMFFSLLIACSANAYSEPYQLDVAGVIPGVSTKSQVELIKEGSSYVVGGLGLLCVDFYIDGRVSDFTCFFGKEYYSRDLVAEEGLKQIQLLSNTEVYEKLLYGFTEKFKTAPEIATEEMVNGLGVKSNRYIAVWRDTKGNALYLRSVERNVNEGTLILRSAEYMAAESKKLEEESQRRKF